MPRPGPISVVPAPDSDGPAVPLRQPPAAPCVGARQTWQQHRRSCRHQTRAPDGVAQTIPLWLSNPLRAPWLNQGDRRLRNGRWAKIRQHSGPEFVSRARWALELSESLETETGKDVTQVLIAPIRSGATRPWRKNHVTRPVADLYEARLPSP